MFRHREGIQRLVFFFSLVLVTIVVSLFVLSFSTDVWLRTCAVGISVIALCLGYLLASDRTISDNRVRLQVLSFASATLLAVFNFRSQLLNGLKNMGLPISQTPLWGQGGPDLPSLTIVLAVVAICALVLRSIRFTPAMGSPEGNIRDILPKITNFDRLDTLKRALIGHLDQIDSTTRWNDANYVPLEAEVQVLEGRSSRRKIIDLQVALRNDQRTRIFVVLGEPGTGKSVAMRKLARDLVAQSARSARIPIYVNLKEWRTEKMWAIESPPTADDFYDFLYLNVLETLDISSQSFLQEVEKGESKDNFKRLFEAGFFFFILDSFDEIPAVLDHDENSWLIESLSNLIINSVLSGVKSRAVIASRLFRKPKVVSRERSVFEIRPFSDDRIVRAIRNAANDPNQLIRAIFTERRDLGILARNPFLLHLVINHYNTTREVPSSQTEMFETFFKSNIDLARKTYGFKSLDESKIYEICEDISNVMFDRPNIGLEITDVELQKEINNPLLPDVLRFITQARIGRLGATSGAFSFSHRRFNEYFLVRRLASRRSVVPYDAIQVDSRWRDALVLYAEIAPSAEAKKLAAHAWSYARELRVYSLGRERSRFIEARHALRFIIEGFRNRPALLSPFHHDIASVIEEKIGWETDYIEVKTAAEALAILPIERSYPMILTILQEFPGWISEQAAAAARYFPRVDRAMALALYRHCVARPWLEGLTEAKRNAPIFAISDAFKVVFNWLWWYRFDFYKLTAICATLMLALSIIDYRNIIPILMALLLCMAAGLVLQWPSWLRLPALEVDSLRMYMGLFVIGLVLDIGNLAGQVVRPLSMGVIREVYIIPVRGLEYGSPLFLLAMFGVIPFAPSVWADMLVVLRRGWVRLVTFRVRWSGVRGFLQILGAIVLFGGVGVAVAAGLGFLAPRFPVLGQLVGIAAILYWGWIIWRWYGISLRDLSLDWANYRKISRQKFIPTRAVIAEQFTVFKTDYFRTLIVAWFEMNALDYLDVLQRADNAWPGGKRPQIRGDTASVRLAELDARWLHLD